jgi:beta-galactosidase
MTWSSAFDEQGNYNVKTKDTLKTVIIRGSFNLPDLTDDKEISLWPKSLGEEQTIYINGHAIAKNIKRDDPVQKYKLDNSILHKGKNIYALVGIPLVARFQYDNLNTDPGIIQILMPSDNWKRKVFNGLAQVIIQADKQPGEIKITATSPGLSQAELKLQVKPTILRPSVSAE